MNPSEILLGIAIIGAIVFLGVQNKTFFKLRPFIKSVMGVALAVYCFSIGNTALAFMGVGFILSSLGDFFLDYPEDRYFVPGLIAFFTAHAAFLIYLWPFADWSVPICAIVVLFTLGFFVWLKPSLDQDFIIPVAAYSIIIALMGSAAMTTTLPSLAIPLGATLFIASDVVLSVEKFKVKFKGDKTINWILYASGQIALAIGVVSSLPLQSY